MRPTRPTRGLLALFVAAGLAALPAAAIAADTTVSFTIAASGSLAVSQASGSSTIDENGSTAEYSATDSSTVTGDLPETTVTDTRGTPNANWTVTVSALDHFEHSENDSFTVDKNQGRVYMEAANAAALVTALGGDLSGMTVTGGTFTAAGAENLGSPYTLLTGKTVLGNGSIVYTPSMTLNIPAATPAGTYSAIVRQTVG